MRIQIEKLVYGGAGMARTAQGIIFVERVLPGEQVEVDVIDQRTDYARARLTRVLEPSPDRQNPSCPNFETVGCCNWNHVRPESQSDFKESILRESLKRLGSIDWTQPIDRTEGPARGYRLRASFRVHERQPCFLSRETGQPVPIQECGALMPSLNAFLSEAREVLGQTRLAGTTMVRVVASPDADQIDAVFQNGQSRVRWLDRYPLTRVMQLEFRLRPDRFFQPNRFLLESLMAKVVETAGKGNLLLDLYCGSGFFSLALAGRFGRVIGVDRHASGNAEWNARRNRIRNVDFVKASAWAYLKHTRVRPDAVLLDPPRTGAGKGVIQGLTMLQPERIVYVSCNPTTFAPEARRIEQAGYRLGKLRLIDQFPNTHHIETIALFERS